MLFLPIILFGLAIPARSVIQQEEWDFIIAGGGSAGLTLALRLSAYPGVKVLVLEAGPDHAGDITVASPGIFGTMYGNLSYHWEHRIIPQRGLNNRSHAVMAGKGLGGGSAINFLFWTHASRRDIDDWGALGNKNWSWEKLQPYYKKSETFISPSSQQVTDLDLTYLDQSLHGNNGSTVNSFPSTYGPLSSAWPRTFANLGLAVDGDPRGGKATGGFQNPFNINPATNERSYPGSTYTSIAKTRPNLIVITGAFVTKVLFTKLRGVHTATGILYVKDNTTHQATTKREVIISLGGLASPKLLELSGIGDRTLLQSLGIKALTHNPNVGENYQNHLMIPLGFAANPDVPTAEDFSSPSVFQSALSQYISNRTGPFTTVNASSALLTLSQIGLNTSSLLTDLPPLTKEESLIVNSLTLQESPSPAAQLILIQSGMSPQQYNSTLLAFRSPSTSPSDGKFITILALPQRPLSRGSVHISSPDPFTLPIVNSRDLTHPLDIKIAAASVLATQKIASAAPLSSFLMQDKDGNPVFQPGYYHVNNSNVENFVREFAFLTFHFSGTCSMLPRHKGGVVDERFRVYDTKGLRVVDSSVFPLLPAATINSAVIAVAERAADFIKEDYGF